MRLTKPMKLSEKKEASRAECVKQLCDYLKIIGHSSRTPYGRTRVTSKKSPNVYKSCPKMISLEKLKILTPLQKLPKNEEDLGK